MPSGKILRLGYDEIILTPADVSSCSVCLQQNEIEALVALLEYQNWDTRWYSSSLVDIGQDNIDFFTDGLRAKLMAACTDIVLSRFDTDGDYQISTDGGVTYNDAPQSDPRNGYSVLPPLTGDDGTTKRCQAANSIVTYLKNAVASIQTAKDNEASASDLGAVLIGILILLGIITAGWFFAFMGAFVALLYANVTAAEWTAAFDSDLWNQVVCIIFDNTEPDGSYTVDDAKAIASRLQAEVANTTASDFLVGMVKGLWSGGLNTAANQNLGGALVCNCGDCATLEAWSLIHTDPGDWGTDFTIVSPGVISVVAANLDGTYYAGIETDADGTCCKCIDAYADDHLSPPAVAAYHLCGENRHGGGAHSGNAAASGGQCVNHVYYNAATPFTLTFTFVDCS